MLALAASLGLAGAAQASEMLLTITGDVYGVTDVHGELDAVLGSVPSVGDTFIASWLIDPSLAILTGPSGSQANYSSAILGFSFADYSGSQLATVYSFTPSDTNLVQINANSYGGGPDSWRISSSVPVSVSGVQTVSAALNLYTSASANDVTYPFFLPASLSQYPGSGGAYFDQMGFAACSTAGCDQVGVSVEALTVNPVPLPAGGWLLLSGLGALGVAGRVSRTKPLVGFTQECGRACGKTLSNKGLSTVANDVTIKGKKAKKGERMTKGSGWRLATTKGRKRVFVGTLLQTFNMGTRRIAVFSVPK